MGSWGVAVGSLGSGVSTCTILGPLGAQSPVPDRYPSAPFVWGEGPLFRWGRAPYSAWGGPLPPPWRFQSPWLLNYGAVPPVMSYFSAFVAGGRTPFLNRGPVG